MASVTVTELVSGARLYADERSSGSQAYIPDADASTIVRASVVKLRQLLELERGHDLYTSTSNFSTVDGTAAYALPSDYGATLRVRLKWGTGQTEDVHAAEVGEESELEDIGEWAQLGSKRYRIRDSSLHVFPTPDAAVSVEHLYTTRFSTSATTADLLVDGWDEWVKLDAAIRILEIQGKPHTWLKEDREKLEAQLTRAAKDRVVEDATHIVDVAPRFRRRDPWPRPRW